jgi:hypothetical protein
VPISPYKRLVSCNANLPAPIYTPEPDPTAPPSEEPTEEEEPPPEEEEPPPEEEEPAEESP